MEGSDAIVREFVAESLENVAQLEVDLVALEGDPSSRELVSSIFRTIHTVKGTCGFLGFTRLERLAHAGESLLSDWRDGLIETGSESIDLLLRVVDVLRRMLAAIDASGTDDVEAESLASVIDDIDGHLAQARAVRAGDAAGLASTNAKPATAATVATASTADDAVRQPSDAEAAGPSRSADETVRVSVDVLDALVRQVGELVLARNRLGRLALEHRDPELVAVTSNVRSVANALQATVMKTRMQPVSHAWQQLPRLVRDLSASLGKDLELTTTGGETELDRALIDALRDPLTHLVRNAADHGIESLAERRAAGKPDAGRLTLRAFRQGGSLVIEVTDDGRGIDVERVSQRARAMGLVSTEAALAMDEADLVQLVFRPGFSTASSISHVSGRGVGMDVVKSAVDAVRGTVQLTSRPGVGTTCRLLLPVTLAITSSVTVLVGEHRFAIPQSDLRELVRVDGSSSVVEQISGAPVYRLRDELLPVIVLSQELGLGRPAAGLVGTIAVLQVGQRTLGLLVDLVLDTEDVLVEPLDARVGHLGSYVGAAILADGQVSLVLDLHALALRAAPATANLFTDQDAVAPAAPKVVSIARQQCVVAIVGNGRRIALPMDGIARLEVFPLTAVEHMGGRDVVQYRGAVIPLLRLARYLDRRTGADVEPTPLKRAVPAVVYRTGSRAVALAVEEIVDIVAESGAVEMDSEDPRIRGAFIVQERVTEVLDVEAALLVADPQFFEGTEPADGTHASGLVEVAS